MAEPTTSGAAGIAGWKLIGGAAGAAGLGAAATAVVVMCTTLPRTTREWAVALISTVMSSLGLGAFAANLVELLTSQHASGGSGWRRAQELLALAQARLGERVAAEQALYAAQAVTARFVSSVDAAESSLDRAEVMSRLGRSAEAHALARTALAQLQGQAPGSPRLQRARRLLSVSG